MKKFFKISGIILILLLVLIFFGIRHFKKSGVPDYNTQVNIPGLLDEVEVYRDSLGVPHIYASNKHDLYLVTGYLEAQDRMWQMDLIRRVTQGRLSEIFGEKALDADKLLRKLRIPQTSKKWLQNMDDSVANYTQWYADGVNAYIKQAGDDLPLEFKILGYKPEPWKPVHSIQLVGYMSWMLELGYKMEGMATLIAQELGENYLRETLPDWDANKVYVYRQKHAKEIKLDSSLIEAVAFIRKVAPAISFGSNNWVVSGKKSVTGKPIFSNDMHLHLGLPGIWWRAHQVVPGQLNVTGVLLPGSPFVVAGHNEHIAWGMTNVMLDGADFYMEKIDTTNKTYYFNGQWRPLQVVEEEIRVKGKENPEKIQMYFTHRGPVMTRLDDMEIPTVSMRWVGNEESYEMNALYYFNVAKNWEEFRQAASGFKAVSQNIAYADTEGNIGIQCTGRVPVRKGPAYLFMPGQTDEYDWKSFVPFEDLPYEYNPERGYVSSANNKTFADSLYISEWYDLPYRIIRIREMLEGKDKLSTQDFRRMLYDHLSVRARRFLPVLKEVLNKNQFESQEEKQALELLNTWDARYEKDSKAPVVFEEIMRQFVRNLVSDELSPDLFKAYYASFLMHKYLTDRVFRDTTSVWIDNVNTDKKETFSDLALLSFRQALDTLQNKYGDWTQKTWGAVHPLHLEHPLGKVKLLDKLFGLNRDLQAPGSTNTVNPFTYNISNPYVSDFGASQKHIFNTADWDESFSILPAGECGVPGSPHYTDQAQTYVNGGLYPDRFSKEEVTKHARYKAVFKPAEK